MNSEQPSVGTSLREAREQAGLSIRELARKAEVDHSYLARIEKDDVRASANLLQKLADALEIDSAPLLALIGIQSLPEPRAYFRRRLGVDAAEADVLAQLIEDYQAKKNKEGGGNHEETKQD